MQQILLLEDDPYQSETISMDLRQAFPELALTICYTESELIAEIARLPKGSLAFAVLDAMVPWSFPAEDMQVPPVEVQSEGVRFAGRRCLHALRKKFGGDVPIWIYSILSSDGHGVIQQQNTFVLEKQPEENGKLVSAIRSVFNPH